MDRWALNAIISNHVNRVFTAASLAFVASELDPGTIVSLMGNLLWAASPYAAKDRSEEALMAFSGAIAGTLGPTILASQGDADQGATLRACEREFFERHDELIEQVWKALGEAGLRESKSCARVNAKVWALLFPQLDYKQSLAELAHQIRDLD